MIWLLTAVWFGLLTGSVEVVLRGTLQMSLLDIQLFYGPHFVWMAPLSEAILFALVTGSLLLGARLGSRRASPRAVFFLLVCLAVLTLVCMVPGLHPLAALFVAAGVAAHVSRELTKRTPQVMEMVRRSVGRVLAAVALLALGVFGWEKLAEKRALASLPPAAPGAPNVLLLVLDTVRAQNLSAYGYARPTSPRITALANRGVRFEHAISTAPWTTPSHFSMMTGRFPHELIAHWQDALDDTHPTLAEVLGAAGYVSGGFVANMEYAGYESGLDRGFVHFEDYPVSPAELALSSSLAHAILNNQALRNLIGEHQILGRKLAEDVNRDFLDWLSRQDPERPFFAFLNYFDAHSIYLPPDPWDAEFGSEAERDMTGTWHFKRRARHRLKDRTAT
ncbi:MAG TPA: sulfatase-like hydrolase/transferase, partial [Gemmatimonadota bacterium]